MPQERPRGQAGQQGSGQLSVSLGMSHSVSHSSYNSANEVRHNTAGVIPSIVIKLATKVAALRIYAKQTVRPYLNYLASI